MQLYSPAEVLEIVRDTPRLLVKYLKANRAYQYRTSVLEQKLIDDSGMPIDVLNVERDITHERNDFVREINALVE